MQNNNNSEDNKRGDTAPLSSQFPQGKIRMRKCVGCNKIFEQTQLLRVLKESKTNNIIVNPDNKTVGRSAYLCYNPECLNVALKKKRFHKNLRINISSETLEIIENLIKNNNL